MVCVFFNIYYDYYFLFGKKGYPFDECYQFQHLESVIKARIPSITSLINKNISDLESEMDHLGRPIAVDAGVSSFIFLICS